MIQTTFANGVNPFSPVSNKTLPTPEPTMTLQKPTQKRARLPKDEDYSTTYKPPEPTVKESLTVAEPQPEPSAPIYPTDLGLSITNDPLPASRTAPIFKYDTLFDGMTPGQSLRVQTSRVGSVVHAMRKYIGRKGRTQHVKSQPRYQKDTGFGRVWLLDGLSQVPKRKKAV